MSSLTNTITMRRATERACSCFGHWKTQPSLKKYSTRNQRSQPASLVLRIPTSSHAERKTESSWSTTSERRTTCLLLRIRKAWTSTPTRFGTSNGSARERATREKAWWASQLTAESPNGPWRKVWSTLTLCFYEESHNPTRKTPPRTWTLGSQAVFPSSSSRANPRCTSLQQRKEWSIDAPRATPSNTSKSTLATTAPSTKSEPILSCTMPSSPVRLTGAANYGTGGRILLLTHSKALISTTKSSTSNGVPMNPLSSLRFAKTAASNSGTSFLTQGPREEKHAWPHLHSQRPPQKEAPAQDNGPFLPRRPSPRDRRHQRRHRCLPPQS